ncbi:MAG: LolA family protein [Formosimonas sp.]
MFKKICSSAVLASALVGSAALADSAQLLAQVNQIIAKPAGLQVSFSQSKKISGFSSSVNSSGKVKIAQGRGLLWITEKPSSSVLKITGNSISEVRGGNTVFSMNGNSEPKIKAVGTILTSVLSGNFSPLQRYFAVSGSANGASWRLELSPTDSGVRQSIRAISVSGGRYVNSVDISENNGDKTHIGFSSPVVLSVSQVGL